MEDWKKEVECIFCEFAKAFECKIDKTYFIRLQYEIISEYGCAVIQVEVANGNVQIYNEAVIEPENIYVMSIDTLRKLYHHELTALSALANEPDESGEWRSLIEPKYKNEQVKIYLNKKNDDTALEFAKRIHKMDDFFNKDDFYIAKVGAGFCRKLHKVDAIGLYNDFEKGILHAYFSIKEDEILSEPPVDFSVYVLQGEGMIEIGENKIRIVQNEYYHISPKQTVQIRNCCKENLNILYLGQR